MAPKQLLEKEAWKWAETVAPTDVSPENIRTAYRVTLKPCKKQACRRNCKGNPRCLNMIGEQGWLGKIEDSHWHDIDDPETDRRKNDASVGLKNLGATCYVNTFLQLWFHNPVFRSIILQWEEPYFTAADEPSTSFENGCGNKKEQMVCAKPKSIVGHLQLIFAKLMFSNRRCVDPSEFIECMNLDTAEQQDAQEFSKLFTSLLEDRLAGSSNPALRNLINEQFAGQYDYVTRCNVCGKGSDTPSKFLELDLNIKGHNALEDCLSEFLKVEVMEKDDKYDCPHCHQKQKAMRRIMLRSLPPVLNLQLLRFVFDRNTGRKKKLNSYLRFPEELDVGQYIGKEEGEVVYDLTAVLIHRGQTAYSGHYIAHIKSSHTHTWFKFNDEDIEEMPNKNLQLGVEEDELEEQKSGKDKVKKPKVAKGAHCSRNAYMLVYNRRKDPTKPGAQLNMERTDLPVSLQLAIDEDNTSFEAWIKEMSGMKDLNVCKGKSKQEEIQHIYSQMPFSEGEEFEWVTTDWFSKWCADDLSQVTPPIDNTGLLCPHNRLKPDMADHAKCVSKRAADQLFMRYGGEVRLVGEDCFCRECVVRKCRYLHTRARMIQDGKAIAGILKQKLDYSNCDDSYWIGKESFKSWRRLATEKLEEIGRKEDDERAKQTTGTPASHEQTTGAPPSTETRAYGEPPTLTNGSSDGSEVRDDVDPPVRDDVDPPVLEKIDIHKPSTSQDTTTAAKASSDYLLFNEDALCIDHGRCYLDVDDSCRRLVPADIWRRIRSYFPGAQDFPRDASLCPQCMASVEQDKGCYVVHKQVAAAQKSALPDLFLFRNRPSWTKHKQLYVISRRFLDRWREFVREKGNLEPVTSLNNQSLLCKHNNFLYHVDRMDPQHSSSDLVFVKPAEWAHLAGYLSVDQEIEVNRVEEDSGIVTLLTSPDTCDACAKAKREHDLETQLGYSDAKVYIRKITADDLKKNSKGDGLEDEMTEPPEKMMKLDVRRSARRRLPRGTKEVDITSTMSLRDLKKKVFLAFKVMVSDQHLMMDGKELEGEGESLRSLQVVPDTVLQLLADEASLDDVDFLDDGKASLPEEGFKGTGLLGSSAPGTLQS